MGCLLTKVCAQSIRRALQLLRLLAQNNPHGLSLKELTAQSGLERSTAHRLVSALVEEDFVYRNPDTSRYQVGIDAIHIGLSAVGNTSITERLNPLVMRLVRLAEDTVFLVVQQGDYALCLAHKHGDFPARIFTITVGEKRLMGVGAGGLAKLLQQVQETRDDGYSQIVSTITPGISGVGHAFYLSKITRVAISFGAINARLDEKRRKQMGQLLKAECEAWLQNV